MFLRIARVIAACSLITPKTAFVKDGKNRGFASTQIVPSTVNLISLLQIRFQIIRTQAFLQGRKGESSQSTNDTMHSSAGKPSITGYI